MNYKTKSWGIILGYTKNNSNWSSWFSKIVQWYIKDIDIPSQVTPTHIWRWRSARGGAFWRAQRDRIWGEPLYIYIYIYIYIYGMIRILLMLYFRFYVNNICWTTCPKSNNRLSNGSQHGHNIMTVQSHSRLIKASSYVICIRFVYRDFPGATFVQKRTLP